MKRFTIAVILFTTVILMHSGVPPGLYPMSRDSQGGLVVTVNPSAVEVKVGGTVRLNVTVSESGASPLGQVCFDVSGMPSSGFNTTVIPACVDAKQKNRMVTAVVVIDVTPAAAPQKIMALVVATSQAQSGQAGLNVTVVPAVPPLIPWFLVIGFVVVILVALTPSRLFRRRRRTTERAPSCRKKKIARRRSRLPSRGSISRPTRSRRERAVQA